MIGPGLPASPSTRLAIMTVSTRAIRVIDLVDLRTQHALYSFDPSGAVLMFLQDGRISMVDLNGVVRGTYTAPGAVKPAAAQFMSESGSVALCAGVSNSVLEVRRLIFDPADWRVIDDSLLVSDSAPGSVSAITSAGRDALVVRFSTGEVRHYATDGTLLHTFTSVPFTSDNPWHQRLIYFQRPPLVNPGVYMLESAAIVFLDLITGGKNTLVTGDVIDIDVSDERNSMVYETKTGDVWLASSQGLPLSRIAPQNIMPRFNVDGKNLVMVERINRTTDSLHVLRFF